MERDLNSSQWLAGSEFSLADIAIAPYAVRAGEIDVAFRDAERWPASMRWLDCLTQRAWFDDVFAKPPERAAG
jgi:glutathione S-transferase